MYHYITNETLFPILSEITKFGYLGVALFFMISGYVITLSATNRSALEFAISRFVRLYPAFWAGVFITCSISILLGSKHYSAGQIFANLTMLHDYLGFEDIDGVYWTLQVELKFYGCIFILLLAGLFRYFSAWLSVWLFLTVLYLLTEQPFFMGFFINPNQSCFFIAGVAFYLIHQEGLGKFNTFILLSSLALSTIQGFKQASDFMINPDLTSKMVAVLIIWFCYLLFYLLVTERIKLPNKKIYVLLGGLTYPLYLIHNVAGKTIINHLKNITPEWVAIFIVTLLMFSISYLVYIGVEQQVATPMKRALFSLLKTKKEPHS